MVNEGHYVNGAGVRAPESGDWSESTGKNPLIIMV